MADTTFTGMPQATIPLTGTEITGGDQAGVETRKFTTQDIADLATTSAPPQYGNYVVQGGGVNWLGTGFQYSVSAATYVIGGTSYSSAQTDLTLGAADPTNPRIDVFALTTSGTAIIIAGTAAASPLKPTVDSATQFEIGFVYVAAGAVTAPVTNLSIYLNNTEWTAVSSSVRINVDSVSNPFAGTKDIEATLAVAADTVTLTNGSPVTLNIYSNLTMQLRSKATWASQKRLQFQWRLGTASVGTAVQVRTGVYGFNSATTGSYQSVVIPIEDFNVGTATADNLFISVVGGGAAIGWYLDNLINQAGVQSAVDTSGEDMTFAAAHSSITAYNAQDTVTSSGRTYTAIQSVPAGIAITNTSYWSQIAVGAGGTDVAVSDGGTGVSSLTAYAPIFGGTTSTGAVQSGTVGTAGQALLSNGAGALPTFQTVTTTGVAAQIVAAAAKTTPVDADSFGLVDSADSNALKEITFAELMLAIKTANVQSVTSASTVTPTFLNDGVKVTALAAACQLLNWTGTAKEMHGMVIRIKDNGTARALTYDTQYRAIGVTLPTTTVLSKTTYLACIWNDTDTKIDVLAVGQEA